MARELLLLRHGKSDWDQGVADFERPLQERGKQGALKIGLWMVQQGLIPDAIVSSPAVRAFETAKKLSKTMGLDVRAITQDQRIYAAGLPMLLKVLADCPADAQRVVLVGHNPGFEDLVIYLAGDKLSIPPDGKIMPTAALARFTMPDDWHALVEGAGKLESITLPGGLPDKFPYPDANGTEMRERPAYYYRQSSVIPYRMEEGKPEILMVGSIQKKHWTVPKGIWEPGMTAQESALQESREEAGAEGEIDVLPLGQYSYPKWGAMCNVEVYSMRVTRLVDAPDWKEAHRGRTWLSPGQAVKSVRQKELRSMIKKLVKHLMGS